MQDTCKAAGAAAAAAARWPQFRKFSQPRTASETAARWIVSGAVIAAFIAAWQAPDPVPATGARPVVHVRLQQVEIVGKRDRTQDHAPSDTIALSSGSRTPAASAD